MKKPEPTLEQLQAALDRLHAAAPRIWPASLELLADHPNNMKLVRARALQAMGETDLRSREQLPLLCSLPKGGKYVRWVFGKPSSQLAIDKDLT